MSENDEDVTLQEAMDFAAEMAEMEADEFDGPVPEHAAGLLVGRAADIVSLQQKFDMADASEAADGFDAETEADEMAKRVVSLLLGLGTLQFEYDDLDIAGKFEERKQLVEEVKAFKQAMEDADGEEEVQAVMDEYLTDRVAEWMERQQRAPSKVQVGQNVDDEDYDHDRRDRDVA